jgi:phosphoketolase
MALEADALGHRHSSTGKSTLYMHLDRVYKKVDNFEKVLNFTNPFIS